MPGSQVFLSYRRNDAGGHARRLHDRLAQHFGPAEVFWDRDIPAGVDFERYLEAAVGRADVLVALMAADWLTAANARGRRLDQPDDWVRIEIGTALGRGIPVVPVLVGGAAMPTAAELPAALEGLARCRPFRLLDVRWGDDVERLIGELASAGVRRAVPVITPDNADQLGVARAMTGHTAGVSSVAFSPDGYLLASGGGAPPISAIGRLADSERIEDMGDSTIRLWRVADGGALHILRGHSHWVTTVAFAPHGGLLASGAEDGTVRLWRAGDGAPLGTLTGHTHRVAGVAFAPHGDVLASGAEDGTVRLWRASDGAPLRTLTGHTAGVTAVAFAPDGQTLASGSTDGSVRLWRTADGAAIRTLQARSGWRRVKEKVRAVAISPDGEKLASAWGDDALRLWRVRDGAPLPTPDERPGLLNALTWSPDGRLLTAGTFRGSMRLWRVADGWASAEVRVPGEQVFSVAYNPDGTVLASGSWDATVRLWTVGAGRAGAG